MKRFMLICLCILLLAGCGPARPSEPESGAPSLPDSPAPDDLGERPEEVFDSLAEAAKALIESDMDFTGVHEAYYVMNRAGERVSAIAYTWTLQERSNHEENWIEGCLRLEEDGSASYDETQIMALPIESSPMAGEAMLTVEAFEAMVAEIDLEAAFERGHEEADYYNLEYNTDESRRFAASGANPFAYYLVEEGTTLIPRPDGFNSSNDKLPGFHFFAAFPLDSRRRMLPEGFLVFLVPCN